ncbi:MAG TPA: 16S rRNA (cytidine(1402)-2'-O)-methyltransferase [Gemmatimonadaceae bacterium]|nr:16S rRNA (cytidine(1402)-2'-O)-methyltransferase [Gemmatimonadaceae bacterium]
MSAPPRASLFVVSTPIGNLGDMSARAIETLRSVALILAEDTRHSRHLLDHFDIPTPLEAYHEHNEAKATPRFLDRLVRGDSLALISDAGTPLLSDPGARLVRAALDAGIPVVPIPGPSAMLAALVASGIDAARFTFFGFLPRRGRERSSVVSEIVALEHTAILYESPNRLAATLVELTERGAGAREGAVARELTKQYEEVRRGTVEELARYYEQSVVRGEVVIILAGRTLTPPDEDSMRARARELREAGASARDVARTLIVEYGATRNVAYKLAHES